MSRGQTLRALVNERLAAAAEDIFVLIERTIVEYEEELCRSKEENQRNVQIISVSPGPGRNQKNTETPWIKEEPEEQSVKQEEEQLQVPVPESSAVSVETEESSLLQQRQTEETQGEDISSETHFHSETEGHTDHGDHLEPFSWSAPQMETEADGDDYNQVQIRDRSTELSFINRSAPETSVHSGHMSGADGGAEEKKFQCPFCSKRFGTKNYLQTHIRIHKGEKPFSCTYMYCTKHFADRSSLNRHKRTHAEEEPSVHSVLSGDMSGAMKKSHQCPFCPMLFWTKQHLQNHIRVHTGEKPYSCSICKKTFIQKGNLNLHKRKHTGEKPYSCPVCNEHFSDNSVFKRHKRLHTGERPYSCSVCGKTFARKDHLKTHVSIHGI